MIRPIAVAHILFAGGSRERRCCRVQRGGRGGRRGTRVGQVPEGVPQGSTAGARHPEDSRFGAGRPAGKVRLRSGHVGGIESEQVNLGINHVSRTRVRTRSVCEPVP